MRGCVTRDDEPIIFLTVAQLNASFKSFFNPRMSDFLPIYKKQGEPKIIRFLRKKLVLHKKMMSVTLTDPKIRLAFDNR